MNTFRTTKFYKQTNTRYISNGKLKWAVDRKHTPKYIIFNCIVRKTQVPPGMAMKNKELTHECLGKQPHIGTPGMI